jgi:hypothetical protein
VTKRFGHSKVRESKPGLSGSMIRNAIVSPHFRHPGPLIRFTDIVYSPCQVFARRFVGYRASPTNGTVLRKSDVRKVTNVWKKRMLCAATIKEFFK